MRKAFTGSLKEDHDMRLLPVFAIALIALFVAARVLGFVLGAALHLLWIAAVLIMAVWVLNAVGRGRGA